MEYKHPRTVHFLKSGLYDNLSSFSDLETRISQLDSNKERGDAFEVFAQGYLATQKTAQAKNVWPFESIPEKVKRKLSIDTHIDMGVDGVYETTVGDLTAYQVKFRTGRPSLTWDELSTFMGLTEQVDERVLFTNSDGLPEVMNDRSRFFCIRGNDLDRLEASDFDAIREWLSTGLVKVKLKDPTGGMKKAPEGASIPILAHETITSRITWRASAIFSLT